VRLHLLQPMQRPWQLLQQLQGHGRQPVQPDPFLFLQ
jgi:hypothetical protein